MILSRFRAIPTILTFAVLASSCSKKSTTSVSSEIEGAAVPDSELILYSWGEYFDPSLLERFERETGIKVKYDPYESGDEMTEVIKSNPGKYDVVIMDDLRLERMKRTRVIRELDSELLPNLKHLDEKHLPAGHSEGLHSIPYCWGTTLIAYNKNKIGTPKKSWGLLFDPALKGRVSVIDDRMECSTNMLIHLGHPSDSEEEGHIRAASAKLLDLATSQDAILGSDVDANRQLLDDSVWAGMIYSVDLAQALEDKEGAKIGYFHPEEGTTKYVDNFTIPRDSSRWKEAHMFINFMMDPVVAAESSIYVRSATANKSALKYLADKDPELLSSVAFANPSVVTINTEGSQHRQSLIHEGWQDFEKVLQAREVASTANDDE